MVSFWVPFATMRNAGSLLLDTPCGDLLFGEGFSREPHDPPISRGAQF